MRGELKSAFGGRHAPATVFVVSSSLMPSNPFAWAGNAPRVEAMGVPLPGDKELQSLAQGYVPHLQRTIVALMNAIDARVAGDDVRACNAVYLGDKSALAATAAGATAARAPAHAAFPAAVPLAPSDLTARATAILIEYRGRTISLARDGGAWSVSIGSGRAAANEDNVRALLDDLASARVAEPLGSGGGVDAALALVPNDATRVVVSAGSDTVLDLAIGRRGALGTAVRLRGTAEAQLATGLSQYLYERELRDWRDRRIWELDAAGVRRIELRTPRGAWVLARDGGGWRATLDGRPFTSLSQDRVRDLVAAFRHLLAEDFADAAAASAFSGASVIRFDLDGGKRAVLRVGAPAGAKEGASRYAQAEGNPTVYEISAYQARWADVTPAMLGSASR